jgi:hypothetical protein
MKRIECGKKVVGAKARSGKLIVLEGYSTNIISSGI